MTNDDYRHFYSVLEAKLKPYRDAKQHLDRFLSADFNVFNWIEPDEDRLSDIIADLLDQNGSHGQQRRFLNAFLQIIKRPDLKDKKLPKVGREVWTDHNSENPYRRIDIVVEFENKAFGLGIENKYGAGELPRQVQDYVDHLENKYGANGFCLVFLTPDGHMPESIEGSLKEELMSENKLICISYNRDMLKWLAECCLLCESDKFRWFLHDFKGHLDGGQTMSGSTERDTILKHALEKENLETALDINSAFKGDLHGQIIVGFLAELKKYVLDTLGDLDEREWQLDKNLVDSPLQAHKSFGLKKNAWNGQYAVILAPQQNDARDFRIGVWKQKDEPSQPSLKSKLDDTFSRNGDANNWWEWYHYLDAPYRNWNTKEALIKLHDGEAVEPIGQEFVEIIKVAARIIDTHVQKSSS